MGRFRKALSTRLSRILIGGFALFGAAATLYLNVHEAHHTLLRVQYSKTHSQDVISQSGCSICDGIYVSPQASAVFTALEYKTLVHVFIPAPTPKTVFPDTFHLFLARAPPHC